MSLAFGMIRTPLFNQTSKYKKEPLEMSLCPVREVLKIQPLKVWEIIIYRDWATTRTEYVNSRWWTFEDAEERADALVERGECPNIVERSLLNILRHGGPYQNLFPKGKPPDSVRKELELLELNLNKLSESYGKV